MLIPGGQNKLTYSQDSFSIISEDVNTVNFEGRTFSINTRNNFGDGTVQTTTSTATPTDTVAALTLPSSLYSRLGITNSDSRLGFTVYAGDTLFQPRSDSSAARQYADMELAGPIISAFVRDVTVAGLIDPVTVTFQKYRVSTGLHYCYRQLM